MERRYTYPCIFYYDPHPENDNEYKIDVCFPDLVQASIPATTVVTEEANLLESAEETLKISLEMAMSEEYEIPSPTHSPEKLTFDRGTANNIEPPFMIKAGLVSVFLREEIELKQAKKTSHEIEQNTERDAGQILSGRIQNNCYIISKIAGQPISEVVYKPEKIQSLYHAISRQGEPLALNFKGERTEFSKEQSLQLRSELEEIIQTLEKNKKQV